MTAELSRVAPDAALGNDRLTSAYDALATNPMRALLYVVNTEFGADGPTSLYQHGKQLNELQGAGPEITFTSNTCKQVGTLFRKVLVPAGLSQASTSSNGGRTYVPRADILDYGLAVAGAFLDWELTYPDHTMALACGDRKPNVDEGMPTTSLNIYKALLASRTGVPQANFISAIDRPKGTVKRILCDLITRGLLTRSEKQNWLERSATIDAPCVHPSARGIMKAAKLACQDFVESGRTSITMKDLADALADQNPGYTYERLYRTLWRRQPPYLKFDDGNCEGHASLPKVTYGINPQAMEPISDLVLRSRVVFGEKLREDPGRRLYQAAQDRARSIIHNPEDLKYLLAKSVIRTRPGDLRKLSSAQRPGEKIRRLTESLTFYALRVEQV